MKAPARFAGGFAAALVLLAAAAMLLGESAPALATNQHRVFISELLLDPATGADGDQYIELYNMQAHPETLATWSVCTRFQYRFFPNDAVIPPFGTYLIYPSRVAPNEPGIWNAGPFVALSKPAGSLGLYHPMPSGGFTTPANLEDFVQWGAPRQELENVATFSSNATVPPVVPLWLADSLVATPPAGVAIAYLGTYLVPHRPSRDYRFEPPSPGVRNGGILVGVPDDPPVPEAALTAAPNPFSGATRISLRALKAGAAGTVRIFDARGALVREWAFNAVSGVFELAWDGRNAAGRPTPAGLYFCVARGEGVSLTRRLTRLR